jgi:ferric-dicitrate binding protein FerR (iron transport regulator)
MRRISDDRRKRGAIRRSTTLAVALLALDPGPLRAEEVIGGATAIVNQVQGARSGQNVQVNVGDDVFFEEVISTAEASRAHLRLRDRTDFEIGARSRVKLDRYVYSGGAGAGSVVVNATKGVFRFVSSPGGHAPYEVRTPVATIGVRGTAFGVRSLLGRTDVVLYDGVIEVCRIADRVCETMDAACTIVTVTNRRIDRPREITPSDWDFDGACIAGHTTDHAGNPSQNGPGGDHSQSGEFPTIGLGLGALAAGGAVAGAVTSSHKSSQPTFAPLSP